MATWKRLTRAGGDHFPVDVNMDLVTHMQGHADHTTLYFAADEKTHGFLLVSEMPDQIRLAVPLR